MGSRPKSTPVIVQSAPVTTQAEQHIPTPSMAPGATDVSSGATSDGEAVMSSALKQKRKKRGIASTIRHNETADTIAGTAAGGTTGKTKLGQ